jgi:hypothetical protein
MRKVGREFALFAALPTIAAMICVVGLNGDLTQVEALVPVYLAALILALAVVGVYVTAVLFRTIRWLTASVR